MRGIRNDAKIINNAKVIVVILSVNLFNVRTCTDVLLPTPEEKEASAGNDELSF
jgi:hypothetical protein